MTHSSPPHDPSGPLARAMLESAVDYAIISMDLDGVVTSWNSGAAGILGWSSEEICGCPAALFFTPEDRENGVPQAEMRNALANGRSNDERWHQRKDGARFWASGEMLPLRNETGAPIGFMKILRDRTEDKRRTEAEAATARELRISESLKSAILDAALDCIVTIDEDSTVIEWNQAAEQTFGHSRQAALGSDLAELIIPPEYRERHRQGMRRYLSTGEARLLGRRIELEALRSDGSRFPVELAISAISIGGHRHFTAYLRDLTERRQAEERLRETQRRLNAVLDNASVSIFLMDEHQHCVYMNAAAEKLTGYTLAQVRGRPLHDAIHHTYPDGRPFPIEECAIDRAFPENSNMRGEEVFVHKDGRFYPVAFAASPIRDEASKTIGTIIEVRDISEERAAQESLRESEARLRLAVEAGRMAIWELDIATDTLHGSPELNRVLGYPPDASPTIEEIRSRYHPGESERLRRLGKEVLARGDLYAEAEFQYTRPDGSDRWLMLRAEIHRDEDGRPSKFVGVVLDVTERKEAELALEEAHREAEAQAVERAAILGQLAEGVIVTDRAGRITFVNDASAQLHGVARLDVTPESYTETYNLLTEEGYPYPPSQLPLSRAVLHGETVGNARWRIRRPDGTEVVAVGSARPVVSPHDGAKLGAVLTLRDDTARTRAEAALRDLNTRLEERVQERTAELEAAHEQLRHSQKMEAVGQLTGGIAHDFNNLLQGITGSLDIIQKRLAQGRTGDVERFLTGAMTSAKRAAALTHRLLAFSRRQPLDPKPVKANSLVASMEDLLRRTMGERIEMELVLAGGLWLTRCDPNQLENAILNLAINARDAMAEGGRLTIETCNAHLDNAYAARIREVTPGQYVCICVTDTGTGMDEETIARAFDPFFTTKPTGQGTGLGLSMIYGFARQSEGYAKIYSEPGKGTTVKLYLPRFRGSSAEEEELPRLTEEHGAQEGEVVVVVEDEHIVRGLIVDVLEELGYQALEAHDGPSGLSLLESAERVDLLVTDIGLPGLNGRQMADAAREKRPDLKVLFMTGYAENAALANGFLEPGMEMVTKPVAMETLATRIRKMLEHG